MLPWAHLSPYRKWHLDQFSLFAQLTAESPYTLNWSPLYPQNCPFALGDLDPRPNTWFLGLIWVHNPNSISIGSAAFAGLMIVTDRLTDRPHYSVCNIYIRNTTMWPNNNNKSSAVAEMGDHLATVGMSRNWGGAAVEGWVPTGFPSNTMWPGPRPTTLPSGILIYPTSWPQL